jgi:hypothetical protein
MRPFQLREIGGWLLALPLRVTAVVIYLGDDTVLFGSDERFQGRQSNMSIRIGRMSASGQRKRYLGSQLTRERYLHPCNWRQVNDQLGQKRRNKKPTTAQIKQIARGKEGRDRHFETRLLARILSDRRQHTNSWRLMRYSRTPGS